MSDELKPCPFCGTDQPYTSTKAFNGYGIPSDGPCRVCCNACDAFVEGPDPKAAVVAWNQRVPSPELESALEQAKQAREERDTWKFYFDLLTDSYSRVRRELQEAKKAGTPLWRERDTMNSLVLEVNRLRKIVDDAGLDQPEPAPTQATHSASDTR